MRTSLLLALAIFVTHTALAQEAAGTKNTQVDPEHDWSGTASYISRSISNTSSTSTYVSMENKIFHEYRMDATISRGRGTGTSASVTKEYYKYTERVAGQTSVTITEVDGTANGTMATDLIVELDEEFYSLYIPIPACTGKKTKKISGGSTEVSSMGEDEAMIQLEAQPRGKNPNVISGEIKDRKVNENGEIFETILTWSFTRGPLDVELLVFPQTYGTWLPLPGPNETTSGATMNIGLKLQGKGGKEPKIKAKSFELRLVNTSAEPGIAINYPISGAEQKPDIRFTSTAATSDGQELIVGSDNGTTGTAQLASYDGGGYTTLQVEAVLEGGIRIRGTLELPNGETDIDIPKRKKGSRIGEGWLKANGNVTESSDNEASNGNTNNGDGLTAYEEYRGVFSEGKYKRLNPLKKELGVQVEKNIASEMEGGLKLFAAAADVSVIKLFADELPQDRILNVNRRTSTAGPQYALRLEDARLPDGIVGRNEPEAENGKTPKESMRTVVDLMQIKNFYRAQEAAVLAAKGKMPYTLAEEIANTIAHELGHGVNITHHGPNSAVIPRTAVPGNRPAFALYASDGTPKEIPAAGLPLKLVGDKSGNESSGDLGCIIAYTARYQWYFEQAGDRTLVYRAVPLLPQGDHFCSSGKGTGINATGFFGDSRKGNCLSQIRIKVN